MIVRVDADELPRRLRDLASRNQKALKAGLRIGAQRGRAILVRRTPVDTGQLKASWRVRKIAADSKMVAVLENDAPHAGIVEHGARPHPISVEGFLSLVEWARRHGMGGRGRGVRDAVWTHPFYKIRFFGRDVGAAKAADAIAHKIRREGQEPTHFVRNSLPKLRDAVSIEVVRQLKKAGRKKGPG